MNFAILLSGGTGIRAGTEIPKQYLCFGGYMMITSVLAALLDASLVDYVVIMADAAWREKIDKDVEAKGLPSEKLCGSGYKPVVVDLERTAKNRVGESEAAQHIASRDRRLWW